MTAGVAAVTAGALGVLTLPGGPVPPVADRFGTGELLGWMALALGTGGFVFGPRDRRPPVVASGLVASAALLGAGPLACAAIGLAGAVGGLRRTAGLVRERITAATLTAWALPGVLAVAALVGGPSLGRIETASLAQVAVLWAVLALGIPVAEAVASGVYFQPQDRVDVVHMLLRRLEPQSVLTALAVLGAVSYDALGAPALLVVLLPTVAARVGFSLHDDGRRAVTQTLAAMTVLPEWVGIVDSGHSARVRAVVASVGVDLGLESRLRRDLVRAAELHELGHLDGGVVRGDRGRVARSGAAVLDQAGVAERVVRMVAATDPDRPIAAADADVERAAAIIRRCCDLDRERQVDDVDVATRVVVTAVTSGEVAVTSGRPAPGHGHRTGAPVGRR